MNRNSTLNKIAFDAAKEGLVTHSFLAELRDTAMATGLDEEEVEATIASALNGADRIWRGPLGWLLAVVETATRSRVHRRFVDAAVVLAHVVATTRGDRSDRSISMACRTLAEHLGVSRETANKILCQLTDHGLLRRLPPDRTDLNWRDMAQIYRIRQPSHLSEFLDTHPMQASKSGCMSRFSFLSRLMRDKEIRSHAVFQAIGNGPRFTTIDSEVLVWLDHHGATPRTALRAGIKVTSDSVRSSLLRLSSAGIVDEVDDVLVGLWNDDLMEELEQYATRMGIDDRAQVRQQGHAGERAGRLHRRMARTKAFRAIDKDRLAKGLHPIAPDATQWRLRIAGVSAGRAPLLWQAAG